MCVCVCVFTDEEYAKIRRSLLFPPTFLRLLRIFRISRVLRIIKVLSSSLSLSLFLFLFQWTDLKRHEQFP